MCTYIYIYIYIYVCIYIHLNVPLARGVEGVVEVTLGIGRLEVNGRGDDSCLQCLRVVQCVAVCYSALQCAAVWCSALKYGVVYYSKLQYVAAC